MPDTPLTDEELAEIRGRWGTEAPGDILRLLATVEHWKGRAIAAEAIIEGLAQARRGEVGPNPDFETGHITLSDADRDVFAVNLDNPPPPSEALRRAKGARGEALREAALAFEREDPMGIGESGMPGLKGLSPHTGMRLLATNIGITLRIMADDADKETQHG